MDSREILKLLEIDGGMEGVSEIKLFEGYRKNKKNQREKDEVTVKILDMGPDHPKNRYACVATSKNGKEATGNSDSTLEGAIGLVHWNNLD